MFWHLSRDSVRECSGLNEKKIPYLLYIISSSTWNCNPQWRLPGKPSSFSVEWMRERHFEWLLFKCEYNSLKGDKSIRKE